MRSNTAPRSKSPGTLTRKDQLYLACIVSAYGNLVCEMTAKDRESVFSEMRRQLKERQ